ncbi:MAG: preprotein translocase subunit SecG [Planctomycetota bacterium]
MVILINILWLLTSLFLIVVVLIQRGKGGGLAGAFGGVGGSSAFGTRAGDLFTKITVGVFVVWLLLGISLVPMMKRSEVYSGGAAASATPDLGAAQPPAGPAGAPTADTAPPATQQPPPADTAPAAPEASTEKGEEPKVEEPKAESAKPAEEPKGATETPKADEPKASEPAPKAEEKPQ